MAVILEFPKAQRAKEDASRDDRSNESAEIVFFTGVRYEREALFDDDVLFDKAAPDKVRKVRD